MIDGLDGTTGIVVKVGAWHTYAYFKEEGSIRRMSIHVSLTEYDGLVQQYPLKCTEQGGVETVLSPLRFVQREDLTLLRTEM